MLRYVGSRSFSSSARRSGSGNSERKINHSDPFTKPLSGHEVRKLREERFATRKLVEKSGKVFQRPSQSKNYLAKGYTDTVLLPKTKFEMIKPGQNNELLYRKRTTTELYEWQAEQSERPVFVLHDGPPYANGSLHMGHMVNKVLKDIVNRYKVLQGNSVHYKPGWDCHGLPIEQKVAAQFLGMSSSDVPPLDMRKAASKQALKAADSQKDDFTLFGIMADWSKKGTYRTLDPEYEAKQFKIFGEMVRRGLIYRAHRPVYWSPSSQTALAEAEILHIKNHSSRSLYICFDLHPGPSLVDAVKGDSEAARLVEEVQRGKGSISAVIWTTTPWSLPSNMALTVNPELSYSLVVADGGPLEGKFYLVASDRVEAFKKVKIGMSSVGSKYRPVVGELSELATFPGSILLDSTYRHGFLSKRHGNRPILPASYVTAESGTGLVHCAPAHGLDDYHTWQTFSRQNATAAKEDIINPINQRGSYTEEIDSLLHNDPELNIPPNYSLLNSKALGGGGKEVGRLLEANGWVLGEHPIQHSYPYDWRTKLPIIVRATSQWFANLEEIKDAAIAALDKVRFVPETGRARLEAFIRSRNEWCISRQRAWGVPIPVLYNSQTDEPLLTVANVEHISAVLKEKGTDYWWKGEAEEFVAPQEREKGVKWVKGLDTMDVWFDSGSSWSQLPGAEQHSKLDDNFFSSPSKPPADVYLEGSDQHRGWFQSSLLTHVALSPSKDQSVAPYKTILTHGFTVDKKGNKMSKSEGNVISPQFFLLGGPKTKNPAFGADPMRWWVGRVDFTKEITVSPLVIKHASDELRKIRNTIRFLLAYVPLPQDVPAFDSVELDVTERFVMHVLKELNETCKTAYDNYDFAQVARRVAEFANTTISSFYLVNVKDILYSDAKDSKQRQAIIVVLDQVLKTLLASVAPIAPHLAEEAWHFYKGAQRNPTAADAPRESYFRNTWPVVPSVPNSEQAAEDMKDIFLLRDSILINLEDARKVKAVKSSFEVQLKLVLPKDNEKGQAIMRYKDNLTRILNVSYCDIVDELPKKELQTDPTNVWPSLDTCRDTKISFAIEPSRDQECHRCRKFVRKEEEQLCKRCDEVMKSRESDEGLENQEFTDEVDEEMDGSVEDVDLDEAADQTDPNDTSKKP